MALEIGSERYICCKCGKMFSKRAPNFYKSYAELYKGTNHLPVCKECVDVMYSTYLAQSGDAGAAMRQVCRKLDLYWSQAIFDKAMRVTAARSAMSKYLQIVNGVAYAGKSYDDTLLEEGTIWMPDTSVVDEVEVEEIEEPIEEIEIPEDVKMFWGSGYSNRMYDELEQRRKYWMSKFPDGVELDIGTEAIIRQICSLELDINRDRADGKAVDKSINALNTLLGSANLKPVQKKEDADSSLENTPMGVWLYRYENKRPLPDEYEDSKILKYVFTWMGHVCKMLGVKNGYEQMYQNEIDRLRVEKPEYDGDDEEMFMDYMNNCDEPE